MRRRCGAVLWAMVVLGVSACQGGGTVPPASEPDVGAVSVPSGPSAVVRPIDRYRVSDDVVVQVGRAVHRMVNDCLVAKGQPGGVVVDAGALHEFVGNRALADAHLSDLWGWFGEPGEAQSSGYASRTSGGLTVPRGANSDEAMQACMAEATGKVPGQGMGWVALGTLSSLPQGGPPVPSGDSRVVTAVKSWSECLAGRGFPGVTRPAGAPFLRAAGSAEGRDLAVADDACKRETNLVGQLLAVQAAYDERYIEANAGALAAFKEAVDAFLRDHPA